MYGTDYELPLDPAPGTAAGWRPTRNNPNEEVYWDGTGWTARRRWTAAGFLDLPIGPPHPTVATAPRADQRSPRRPGLRRSPVIATAIGVVVAITAVVLVAMNHSSHRGAGSGPEGSQDRTGSFAVSHLRWAAPVATDPLAAQTLSGQLNYLSCPAVTLCVSAHGDGYATTSDGHSWSPPVRLSTYPNLLAVSCASPTFCMAVGGGSGHREATLWQYQNGHWAAPTYFPGYLAAYSVSCPSSRFCMALLGGYTSADSITTYDGRSWSRPVVWRGPGHARSVDCASATFCVAVGATDAYYFDGSSWRSTPLAAEHTDDAFVSISCPSVTFCLTSDAFGEVATFDGRSWSRRQVDPAMATRKTQQGLGLALQTQPSSVSCISATFCVLVDAIGHAFEFNGANWSRPVAIDPQIDMQRGVTMASVSCATTSFCVAIDSDANVMTTH